MHRFLWALSALIVVVFPVSTFGAPASQYVFGRGDFQSGTRATGIAVADFNGDGRSDVAVANQGDNTISGLLGQANGTLGPKTDFAAAVSPVAVAVDSITMSAPTPG